MITISRFTARLRGSAARAAFLVLLFVLGGCETGPPVQEMSDARQAIAVAKEAGAEELAPDDLRAAEAFLDSAEKNLSDRAYAKARSDAVQAKNKALEALAGVENSPEKDPH